MLNNYTCITRKSYIIPQRKVLLTCYVSFKQANCSLKHYRVTVNTFHSSEKRGNTSVICVLVFKSIMDIDGFFFFRIIISGFFISCEPLSKIFSSVEHTVKDNYLHAHWGFPNFYACMRWAMCTFASLLRSDLPGISGPVGWGCGIYRIHLCRGVGTRKECLWYETKSDCEASIMLDVWGIRSTIATRFILAQSSSTW